MIKVQQLMPCDVCRLLNNDYTPKNCGFCRFCDSWICDEDVNRWDRRARAFLKRKVEENFHGDPSYKTGNPEADRQAGL